MTEEDRGGACPGDETQSDRGRQRGHVQVMRLRVTEEDRGGACPGDEAQSDRGGQRGGMSR